MYNMLSFGRIIKTPCIKLPSAWYSTNHPYTNNKYSSKELAEELAKNVIYNKDGLIVLNKPYGITFADGSPKKEDFEITSDTLKPYLKEIFNCEDLFSARVPEKYASGVAVFCTSENVMDNVGKCMRSMRGRYLPVDTYDCIAIGQPTSVHGKFVGGITVQQSSNKKKKGIRLVPEFTKTQVAKGLVKSVEIHHHALKINDLASRIIITPTRRKWHAVRVYAATSLLTPLLGDRVFGSLVRTVLGKPVLVDIFNPASNQPKKLPKELLSKLDLVSREDIEIPLHMHLCTVHLKDFPRRGNYLEFTARPPDFFNWTCDRLDLHEDKIESINQEESVIR